MGNEHMLREETLVLTESTELDSEELDNYMNGREKRRNT